MDKIQVTPEMIKKAGEMLQKVSGENQELLTKAAEATLEKRAQKIAFREVELGLGEPFKSFQDFQEKVAGLMKEDLDVVEKALDRGYSASRKTGDLTTESTVKGKNVFDQFVLTGELTNE
jgi:hypothetical protein